MRVGSSGGSASVTSTHGWIASALNLAAPCRRRSSAMGARILVVDDEASIRDLLAKTLALAE